MSGSHTDLIISLGEHLRGGGWIVFPEITLGSAWIQRNAQRADILAMKPSYRKAQVTIFEVKVSRSDFLADVNAGKYRGYLEHCERLSFATPKGMIKKSEVPEGCGLVTHNDNRWHTVKAARVREYEPDPTVLQSCIFSAADAAWRKERAAWPFWEPRGTSVRHLARSKYLEQNVALSEKAMAFGRYELGKALLLVEDSEKLILNCAHRILSIVTDDETKHDNEGAGRALRYAVSEACAALEEWKRKAAGLEAPTAAMAAARLIESVLNGALPNYGDPKLPHGLDQRVADFVEAFADER